jgi:hypothetical protein
MSTERCALALAAQRKSEQATARARSALRELDQRGEPVTFQSVARHAGVSRQWLYQRPDLRAEIERLRAAGQQRRHGLPAAQRISEASLRQRVATLCGENRQLREENRALKAELALAYGERRQRAGSG